MLSTFKPDFWALSREQKGYYSLAQRERWNLARALGRSRRHCPACDDPEPFELVDSLFNNGLGVHPMLDCVFEALARAEARFSLRFVPQRSHEERLTGNLVSELDAALFLVRPLFAELSQKRYGEVLDVDFLHYDLSKGGTIEKQTGGDLAIILSMDLPDLPPLIRYAAFQVKKINDSSSIPKEQFNTLVGKFGDAAAYLFYDMSTHTLLPPMVLPASNLKDKAEKGKDTASFSMSLNDVDDGLPLSLWLLTRLAKGQAGTSAHSFAAAMERFTQQPQQSGRLAVLTIGRPLDIRLNHDGALDVSLAR